MLQPPQQHKHIVQRLMPLYVAAFFQGFVLWYAIEKLFMTSIGFTSATIGIMAAVYSCIMLIIETPSGILADRWSRKGVLIVASLALMASSLICGLSTSVAMFIAGAILWGVFFALYSGTYDSIVYDTLLEETGVGSGYERHYGRVNIVDSVALVASSLAGGVVAATFGLRASFLWSIPFILISIIALFMFREPKLHKAEVADPILSHIKNTFSAVLHNGSLIGVLIILVFGATLTHTLLEFDQLWLLAVSTPTVLYGPATALLLSTFGIAGFVASRLRLDQRKVVVPLVILLLTAGFTLITIHSTWPLIFAILAITISMVSIGIVYKRRLHDQLPSKIRSGASSAVATMGRLVFILIALGIGWVTQHSSIFVAGWLILIPLMLVCLFLYVSAGTNGNSEEAIQDPSSTTGDGLPNPR